MLHGPLALRALFLLLAFGLGGLAVPAAHAWSHLGDLTPASPQTEQPRFQGGGEQAVLHDCDLCDVRMAAVDVSSAPPGEGERTAGPPASVTEAPALSAQRSYFGRAPPARS